MSGIRLILALDAQILADLLRSTFSDEPDIDVVFETNDVLDLLLATRQHEPHLVVMTVSPQGRLPPIGTHLLAEFPALLVVGITSEGERVFTFRNTIRTEHHALDDVRGLISQLRTAVANHSR